MPHGKLSNFLLKITFYLLSLWICMCVHKPQCMCGGQETTCWSQVFSSTLWVLGNRTQLWRQTSESFCWPQGFWFCFTKVSSLGGSSNLMPHLKFCIVFSLQRDAEGPKQCDLGKLLGAYFLRLSFNYVCVCVCCVYMHRNTGAYRGQKKELKPQTGITDIRAAMSAL